MTSCVVLLAFLLSCFLASVSLQQVCPYPSVIVLVLPVIDKDAYDPLDPYGNITIKLDVISWTPDGYVAVVTIYNYQQHRRIEAPGWILGWTWSEKEVIWSMVGGETMEKDECDRFKGSNIPESCTENPRFVDLPPSAPYSQQIANCCKGGVLSSWGKDGANAVSSFQIIVGAAGDTNRTVKLPKNHTFSAPGGGYACGPAKIVKPTRFITPDGRRMTQAMMTWKVICTYSAFLAYKDSPRSIVLAPGPDTDTWPTPNLAPTATKTNSLSPAPLPSFSSCSSSFLFSFSLLFLSFFALCSL